MHYRRDVLRQYVPETEISSIAEMLTEDPNILLEFSGLSQQELQDIANVLTAVVDRDIGNNIPAEAERLLTSVNRALEGREGEMSQFRTSLGDLGTYQHSDEPDPFFRQ